MNERAITLIEMVIVVAIALVLLIPISQMINRYRYSAYKGVDKLESLDTARFILEQCTRDLKTLCYDKDGQVLIASGSDKDQYRFPIFPGQEFGLGMRSASNPVNLITYKFDPKKLTLVRTEKIHPLLSGKNQGTKTDLLGSNVASFSISYLKLWDMNFFRIRVKCKSLHPQRHEVVELQTAVRSEYESCLERHLSQVPNRTAWLELPP
jgi:hypothetical protein